MRMIQVRKRDGAHVDFNLQKIVIAVTRAIKSSKSKDYDAKVLKSEVDGIAPLIAANIQQYAQQQEHITIEEIHNKVEQELMKFEYYEAAKAYILYRDRKRESRAKERDEKRKLLNIEGELDPVSERFSLNALRVLESRYLIKDENGKVIETPTQLFERVATHVGCANIMYDEEVFDKEGKRDSLQIGLGYSVKQPEEYENMNLSIGKYKLNKYNLKQLESLYSKLTKENKMKVDFDNILNMIKDGKFDKYEKTIKSYFDLMVSQKYMANTPALVNAGRRLGNLAACYTLPIEDTLDSIMDTSKYMSKIHQSGGGTGFNYSNLREKGARISSTSGTSSGPISFMNIVNTITDVVKSGGVRRGANMSILESQSPDILEFIHVKETPHVLENFNISVGIDTKFWECYKDNKPYELISPHTKEIKGMVNPRDLIDEIAQGAWRSAEPGCLFFDNANKYQVMKPLKGDIKVTNPCAEQFLYPYESCNLGSINISKFVKDKIFDFDAFGKTVQTCIEFLDNVVDINKYPIEQIDNESWNTRRVGLGLMGIADLLYILEIPYNSKEAYELKAQIAQFMAYKAIEKSIEISKRRGSFPYYNKTLCKEGKLDIAGIYEKPLVDIIKLDWDKLLDDVKNIGIRNVYCLTIAPTGSISMLADCSSGIEPLFALAFEKKVAVGNFTYINPYLEKYLKAHNIEYDEETIKQIAKTGSCQSTNLPDNIKKIFVTALDMHWMDHVIAQAVFQQFIDNSLSKTINFLNNATVEDIKNAYLFAHELGCKGLSVYRDGSRHTQVLYTENMENKTLTPSPYAKKIYDEKMEKFNLINKSLNEELKEIRSENPNLIQMFDDNPDQIYSKEICLKCNVKYVFQEKCFKCPSCGSGGCST